MAIYREPEGREYGVLTETLGRLARQPGLERVALRGLTAAEVGRLMTQTTGRAAPGADVATVHARTEGNPFFVCELSGVLASEGGFDSSHSRTIPAGVRDVIRYRLARLPAPTNALLTLAAVIGRDFDLRVIAAASQTELDQSLTLIEPAIATGIVSEDLASPGHYRFSHALVQEAIYLSIGGLRRSRVHARVAQAIAALSAPSEATAELAYHFAEAAPAIGGDLASTYALKMADIARATLAFEDTEHHLRRALRVLELMAPGPQRAQRELGVQSRLASLLMMIHGHGAPEVGQACARALELCDSIGDSDELLPALWGLGLFHQVRADFALTEQLGAQLVKMADRSGPASLAAGNLLIGISEVYTGRPRAARANLVRAQHLTAELDLSVTVAEQYSVHPAISSRCVLAWTTWILGGVHDAKELSRQAAELAMRLAHPFTLAFALFTDTYVAVLRGNAEDAIRRADNTIEVCREHHFHSVEAMACILRGWALARRGDEEVGIDDMRRGLAAHDATGARMQRTYFLGLLADTERQAGDTERAIGHLQDAFDTMAATGETFYEAELHRLYAEIGSQSLSRE